MNTRNIPILEGKDLRSGQKQRHNSGSAYPNLLLSDASSIVDEELLTLEEEYQAHLNHQSMEWKPK